MHASSSEPIAAASAEGTSSQYCRVVRLRVARSISSRVAGGSRLTPPVDRRGLGDEVPAQHRVRGVVIDLEARSERRQASVERAQLRPERDRGTRVRDEERLDPEAIAAEHDASTSTVVDCERPHTDEVLLDAVRILFVEPENDLGVTPRPEDDTAALEPRSQLRRVVDLAVVDDDDRLVLVRHGLVTVDDVDDREPLHPERRVGMGDDPAAIRTAVVDSLRHSRDDCRGALERALERDEANDSAHRGRLYHGCGRRTGDAPDDRDYPRALLRGHVARAGKTDPATEEILGDPPPHCLALGEDGLQVERLPHGASLDVLGDEGGHEHVA